MAFGETLSWRTRFVVTSASSKLLHLFKSTICVWSSDSWWQPEIRHHIEVCSLSYYFQGFIHPWWLFGISEPWTVSSHPLGFFLIEEPSGFHKPSSPRGRLEFGSEPAKLKVRTVELIAPPFILKNLSRYIYIYLLFFVYYLVVEPPVWKICSSKWESSPNFGVKIQNIWNHHLVFIISIKCVSIIILLQ